MVSISCITYNHENYIADALENFLMQKTNFLFEVLVHDDASTDRTADIIREYEKEYPEIIKPIYQKVNQYSQGIKVSNINYARKKGKYYAICEGDDYWIDPYKLQKQVDYMEGHPECSACVHAAYRVSYDKNMFSDHIAPCKTSKNYYPDEVILGGAAMFATNSTLYRSKYRKDLPDFFRISDVGDYPLMVYLSLKGYIHYMAEFMSAYRFRVPGGWTDQFSKSVDFQVAHMKNSNNMLESVDSYSNFLYTDAINKKIKHNQLNILLAQGKYKEIRSENFKGIYNTLSLDKKIKIFIQQYFPNIACMLILIKKRLRIMTNKSI